MADMICHKVYELLMSILKIYNTGIMKATTVYAFVFIANRAKAKFVLHRKFI
jgi:hypothetical protein